MNKKAGSSMLKNPDVEVLGGVEDVVVNLKIQIGSLLARQTKENADMILDLCSETMNEDCLDILRERRVARNKSRA